MVRTRDDSSVEGMELELKVDHLPDLEAAPSCAASSIPEGVAPDDEEDGLHNAGIRGMTVAFQVRLARQSAGRSCFPSSAHHTTNAPALQRVSLLFDIDSLTVKMRDMLMLLSGKQRTPSPSTIDPGHCCWTCGSVMTQNMHCALLACRTLSTSSRTAQNGERRSVSCPKCLAPSLPPTSLPWSAPYSCPPLLQCWTWALQ